MIDFATVLAASPNGVLATQDGRGVRTRVFQYLFIDGNRVYFCTGSDKAVYEQLQANPKVSFCTYAADFNPVLSLNGEVVFVDDRALKTRALEENPHIKDIYQEPDNPIFKIFYLDAKEAETFSFSEGSKSYTL